MSPSPQGRERKRRWRCLPSTGFCALTLWCLLPRGWAIAQQGEWPAGIADIREAMDRRRAFGMGAVWPWYLALFAEAYGANRQIRRRA